MAIVSHYDSVPEGPGAADDAFGVGVSLEAARVLAARSDRNWTLMILVTDGEEAGLMGAAALVTDREVTSRLQAYVNLEAIGSAGTPTLFETGPGNGVARRTRGPAWLPTRAARRYGLEIYRRLPNDTDFSILKRQGIPGLNFAAVEDSYAYHTTRDTPERLSPATVRTAGEQVVAIMTALDAVDITQRSAVNPTFFDIARQNGLLVRSDREPGFRWRGVAPRRRRVGKSDAARRSASRVCCGGCSRRSGRSLDRSPSSRRWSARPGRCARRARCITPGTRDPADCFCCSSPSA